MFGERLHGLIRRGTEQDRLSRPDFRCLGKHLQRSRGYLVVANFGVNPDYVCHLDHLDFS
jgi:hypothetical protein